ncbi:MAG: response regulator [Alphaproteobacteria bacterium]|nr:response regulator [Alphaproteobacteria bacterium]
MARILIIDDEPDIRKAMRSLLEKEGHGVVEAANGVLGLRQFDAGDFDLVITDIVMPEKEGIETILHIRRIKPGQKILAISGGGPSGNLHYLQSAKTLGADEVLTKPFDAEELSQAIRVCIG